VLAVIVLSFGLIVYNW